MMVAAIFQDALVKDVDDWFDNTLVEASRDAAVAQFPARANHSNGFAYLKTLRGLTNGAVDCLLAHWYLLPGLQFQRFRVLLGMSIVLRRQRLAKSTLSKVLDQPPLAASYFGFDFAWKSLSARGTLGRYIDVSSPWLFPVALLSRCRASSATLVSSEADALRDLLGPAKAVATEHPAAELFGEEESYDTITSLSWLERVPDDVKAVARLWRILRPGGALLLCLPCARNAVEQWKENTPAPTGPRSRRKLSRRVYDARLLSGHIFEITGAPKRYAIYGERGSPSGGACNRRIADSVQSGWRASMIIGRDWCCYSSIRSLPGQGVIAMKFVKPEEGKTAGQFSLHLN